MFGFLRVDSMAFGRQESSYKGLFQCLMGDRNAFSNLDRSADSLAGSQASSVGSAQRHCHFAVGP